MNPAKLKLPDGIDKKLVGVGVMVAAAAAAAAIWLDQRRPALPAAPGGPRPRSADGRFAKRGGG